MKTWLPFQTLYTPASTPQSSHKLFIHSTRVYPKIADDFQKAIEAAFWIASDTLQARPPVRPQSTTFSECVRAPSGAEFGCLPLNILSPAPSPPKKLPLPISRWRSPLPLPSSGPPARVPPSPLAPFQGNWGKRAAKALFHRCYLSTPLLSFDSEIYSWWITIRGTNDSNYWRTPSNQLEPTAGSRFFLYTPFW